MPSEREVLPVHDAGGAGSVSSKQYFLGTHRTRSPEETWRVIQPYFERMGITRVADVTRLDTIGIPVYQAVRPGSLNLSVSQGKGATPMAARVSAAMESVEMWHAEDLDHVPCRDLTINEMRYQNPFPERALRWMTATRAFENVPIRWVEARSLTGGESAWMPRDMVELDFSARELFRPQMFVRNSNGLASGNDLHEALLHGLCEVIERHGWYLSQVEPERMVAIDERSIRSELLGGLIERIRSAGLKLGLYDLTWEAGLPTSFVKLVAPDMPVVWHGSGCHASAEVALARGITEAAQSRLTFIAGARDDLVPLAKGATYHRSYEEFVEPAPGRRFDQIEDVATSRVDLDVEAVVARLVGQGFEPYWIDLSRPELDVSVVSVCVPGLKEMHG